MILVVGHGPSSEVDPEWIDAQDFVVRLHTGTHKQLQRTYIPHIGSKVDAIVTARRINVFNEQTVWSAPDYRELLIELSRPFTRKKLSTGTIGCLIAHILYPDSDIGVIGFDTTMNGYNLDKRGFWKLHDARGEGNLLRSIGVTDHGENLRIQS